MVLADMALDGGVFDDDYADLAFFETEALRYFSILWLPSANRC